MTPFKDMEELKKGNVAVALALGGKFVATAIILGIAAYTNTSIWFMMLWFVVGYLCLVAAYWIFELVTPGFKISDHLQKGNVAVGIMLCMVFIGTAFAFSSLII
jgi:putative membrane protein